MGKKVLKVLFILIASIIVLWLALLGTCKLMIRDRVSWSNTSGQPVPSAFMVMLFPADDHVQLTSQSGATKMLDRAVLCSYDEYQKGQMGVWWNDEEIPVDLNRLVPYRTDVDLDKLIDGLNKEIATWRESKIYGVYPKFHKAADGSIEIKMYESNGWWGQDYFYYRVIDGKIIPEKIVRRA